MKKKSYYDQYGLGGFVKDAFMEGIVSGIPIIGNLADNYTPETKFGRGLEKVMTPVNNIKNSIGYAALNMATGGIGGSALKMADEAVNSRTDKSYLKRNDKVVQPYGQGGEVMPSTFINIEKGELRVNPENGEILEQYNDKRFSKHAKKGKEENPNNFVVADEGDFIIPSKYADRYINFPEFRQSIVRNVRNNKLDNRPKYIQDAEGKFAQYTEGSDVFMNDQQKWLNYYNNLTQPNQNINSFDLIMPGLQYENYKAPEAKPLGVSNGNPMLGKKSIAQMVAERDAMLDAVPKTDRTLSDQLNKDNIDRSTRLARMFGKGQDIIDNADYERKQDDMAYYSQMLGDSAYAYYANKTPFSYSNFMPSTAVDMLKGLPEPEFRAARQQSASMFNNAVRSLDGLNQSQRAARLNALLPSMFEQENQLSQAEYNAQLQNKQAVASAQMNLDQYNTQVRNVDKERREQYEGEKNKRMAELAQKSSQYGLVRHKQRKQEIVDAKKMAAQYDYLKLLSQTLPAFRSNYEAIYGYPDLSK